MGSEEKAVRSDWLYLGRKLECRRVIRDMGRGQYSAGRIANKRAKASTCSNRRGGDR